MTFNELCEVKDFMGAVVQLEARIRKDTKLNLNQAFALCCLSSGPHTASQLANRLSVPAPSLSRIIKSLQKLQLIEAVGNPADARHKLLQLSANGTTRAAELLSLEKTWFPFSIPQKEAQPV